MNTSLSRFIKLETLILILTALFAASGGYYGHVGKTAVERQKMQGDLEKFTVLFKERMTILDEKLCSLKDEFKPMQKDLNGIKSRLDRVEVLLEVQKEMR